MASASGRFWLVLMIVLCRALPGAGQDKTITTRQTAWPCRLVVQPPLRGVIEGAYAQSETLQRQCQELAQAAAVVLLEWGTTDSQSRAISHMHVRDGVVVARVTIPPVRDAIELVAHELHHVVEYVRGIDLSSAADRPGSGVWRAFGGIETQAAIDAGRQVAKEVREATKMTKEREKER